MKFIQVKDGTAIAVDHIKMITKSGDFSCRIYTSFDIYEVNTPYVTLMSLLETDNQKDNSTLEKIYNIVKQTGIQVP